MKSAFKLGECLIRSACLLLVFFSLGATALQTAQPYTTVYRYDFAGRVTGVIKPDPDGPGGTLGSPAIRSTYAAGVLTLVETGYLANFANEGVPPSDWSGFTVFQKEVPGYDTYGRKNKSTVYGTNGAVLSVSEISYDSNSRVLCKAVRMNLTATGDACSSSNLTGLNPDRITRYTYDDLDQVTTEERGVGTSLQQNYVSNVYEGKNLRFQVDANCNKTELRYDGYSRVEKVIYPSIIAPLSSGQTCAKPTTPNSLPSNAGAVSQSENDYVQFGYDLNGNKTFERKRNNSQIYFTFDNNNRMIFKNYVNTSMSDIAYNYDLRGLQLSARVGSDSGLGIATAFDGFGNVVSSTNTLLSPSKTYTFKYDKNNNRTHITHPDSALFTYSFDGLNRVTGVADSAGSTMLAVNYQNNGRRQSLVRPANTNTLYNFNNGVQLSSFQQNFATATHNLTNSFTYNAAGQIGSLTKSNSSYDYLGADDRSGAYVPDGLNRYTTIAGQSLSYDLNSNLTNDGSSTYTYDDENRLLTVTGSNSGQFAYDPNGRLYRSTINGVVTQYGYAGDAMVAEFNSSGTLIRRYVHGDQVDEPWVQYNTSSTAADQRRYLRADHQGSIIAHSDAVGNVQSTLAYDSYGIPMAKNNLVVGAFGYTGQMVFKELGLNYYKARVYSPKLGRFLQTDPIGYKDDMDLYTYVGNDPLNKTDPTGKTIVLDKNLNAEQQKMIKDALKEMIKTTAGLKTFNTLHGSSHKFAITSGQGRNGFAVANMSAAKTSGIGSGGAININPGTKSSVVDSKGGTSRPESVAMAHEMGHALDANSGKYIEGHSVRATPGTTPDFERTAVKTEDAVRTELNLPLRQSYFPSESAQKAACGGNLCEGANEMVSP